LQVRHESLRIGGEKIRRAELIEVFNPYNSELVGTVPKATLADVQHAFAWARGYRAQLTRYERSQILRRAAEIVRERTEEIADLITAESGLCKKDSLYEAGRVSDVMTFGANEALKDDGQVFSCESHPTRQETPRLHAARSPARCHCRDHAVQPVRTGSTTSHGLLRSWRSAV
jgi:aldehyde dehydrogenase (NAD+)